MPGSPSNARAWVLIVLGGSLVLTAPAGGQWNDVHHSTTSASEWAGGVALVSVNALIGGLSAGVSQAIRGGSFQDGFTRGAAGGAVAFGGRWVAVENFPGAGFLGRQLSAAGVSVVRNAGEGRSSLSRLAVPLGPLSLYVLRDSATTRVDARLDLHGTTWLLAALADDRIVLDGLATISAGAPVFRSPRHRLGSDGFHPRGLEIGGLILLGSDADNLPGRDVLAHERVHVLQYDFMQEVWGDPIEAWIGGVLPGGDTILRFIRPGVLAPGFVGGVTRLFDIEWADRPWEIEAEYLEGR